MRDVHGSSLVNFEMRGTEVRGFSSSSFGRLA